MTKPMEDFEKLSKIELIEKLRQFSLQNDILNNITSFVPTAIAILDAPSLTYVFTNQNYSKLTGVASVDMSGKHISEVIGPKKYKLAESYLKQALTGKHIEFELPNNHRWIKISYTPVLDEGKKVSRIIINSNDLSDQKEIQLAIYENEKRYRSLIYHLPDSVLVHTKGVIKYVNPAIARMYGLEENNVIGEEIDRFLSIGKDQESVNRLRDRLSKADDPNPFEEILYGKNGESFEAEIYTAPCIYEGEESVQIMIRDITLRKKAINQVAEYYKVLNQEVEKQTYDLSQQTQKLKDSQIALTFLLEDVNDARKEIMQSNAELETANTDLESFAYSVSHDLRAPLRHIDGFSQILQNKINNNSEEVLHYFNKIHNASSKMHNLINDLLTFSRLGRKKPKEVAVDLNSLVAQLIKDSDPDLKKRIIEWEIDTFPPISGDEEMLKIAFENLLSNALKFTSKNEVTKISIRINKDKPSPKTISISIKDNGVGFDMQYAHKIFGVFERLHNSDDFAGTGIGMAIVKRIIQSHKGDIIAYGKIDEGAQFTVSLPLSK